MLFEQKECWQDLQHPPTAFLLSFSNRVVKTL
jgi:hypothetical protein